MDAHLKGLYVITDPLLTPGPHLLDAAEAALHGGARVLQYRDKQASAIQKQHRALALRRMCADHGALFFINDDIELALTVDADGVHLGQADGAAHGGLVAARSRLGNKLMGVTCHGDLDLALNAVHAGADYLAFGRFFESNTKPAAPPCSIEILKQARARFALPLLAIGGVTPDNGAALISAGADMLAAIAGVFAQEDVEAAARKYAALFSVSRQE